MSKQRVRVVGSLSMAALTLIILGCMSLSFGGRNYTANCVDDEVLCQEGCVTFRRCDEHTVYYPIPYASPPNLSLRSPFDDLVLLEQKPDSFRVAWKGLGPSFGTEEVTWKAKGVRRCPPCSAPAPVESVPVESAPPPKLPELPVPVEKPKS
jgi:hypothetical protein